jgi:hypothetical protein
MEELLIKKIKSGINAIKNGIKSPKEIGLGVHLNKLKILNQMMYEELIEDYKVAVQKYNEKN